MREFYSILDELPQRMSADYMGELSKFAWLGQYISKLMGGDSTVYEDVLKIQSEMLNKSVGSDIEEKQPKTDISEEWKAKAQNRGLKIGGE